MTFSRQLDAQIECGEQASWIRGSCPRAVGGKVKRSPMVDRGADDGEAQRHVNTVTEAGMLQHRQALVMVHRDYAVERFHLRGDEYRVGGKRPDEIEPGVAQRCNDRGDEIDLLSTEVPAFAGMGIEAADRDSRPLKAELRDEISSNYPERCR